MSLIIGSTSLKKKSTEVQYLLAILYTQFQNCNAQSDKQKIHENFCLIAGDLIPVKGKQTPSPEQSNQKLLFNVNILIAMAAVVKKEQAYLSNKALKDEKNAALEKIISKYINANNEAEALAALKDFVEVASKVRKGPGVAAEFGKTTSMKVFIEHLGEAEKIEHLLVLAREKGLVFAAELSS